MIGLAAALALAMQQPPPVPMVNLQPVLRDTPAAMAFGLETCRLGQDLRARNPGVSTHLSTLPWTAQDSGDGVITIDYGGCRILAHVWRPDGDLLARTVQTELADWSPAMVVEDWRKPVVSEFGPTVWTTFEQRGAGGNVIGVVRLIEPADGAWGEASVTYEAVTP